MTDYLADFRTKVLAQGLYERIAAISTKKASIMEVCGTHTHAISKYGIRSALPTNIRLVSGPGCPVCVTSAQDINRVINLCRSRHDVTVAVFGDMLRVPDGAGDSIEKARADGADVKVVYSPMDAVYMALADPGKQVVLIAAGFETTAPTVAATILRAVELGIDNLSALSLHKLTPPAMKAIMDSGSLRIDGFLCPGHVTAITGTDAYAFIAREYGSPCVVAGFEPIDALMGIYMLIKQIEAGTAEIENEYSRVARPEGNTKAQRLIDEVFRPCKSMWRGIGMIPESGLEIRGAYAGFDALERFCLPEGVGDDPKGCLCGEVIKGAVEPTDCALFGSICTPDEPVGPCMVSFEGTCAAYYRYSGAFAQDARR